MCSGSARVWEQLCSPGEPNSGLEVPRSPSDALSDSPTRPPPLRNLPTVSVVSAQQCKQKGKKSLDLPYQDKFDVLVRFRLYSSFYFVFSHYYFLTLLFY
jgi:hypothetical protein